MGKARRLVSCLCSIGFLALVHFGFSAANPVVSTYAQSDPDAPTLALARNVQYTIGAEDIIIYSPLYTATLDKLTRTAESITFDVRAEDTIEDHDIDRRWWLPEELEPFALEGNDYLASGYDRGHLRSISMSWGSDHWEDVNCTAVIVPETPNLNRGRIRELEEYIVEKSREHGTCHVHISFTYDDDIVRSMRRADEPHDIPDVITYVVMYPGSVEELYTFDN